MRERKKTIIVPSNKRFKRDGGVYSGSLDLDFGFDLLAAGNDVFSAVTGAGFAWCRWRRYAWFRTGNGDREWMDGWGWEQDERAYGGIDVNFFSYLSHF